MPRPTFLGIGAARCGTTTLDAYLREHPQVGMAWTKEVNWFGWNGDRWLSATPHAPRMHSGVMDQCLYENCFPAVADVRGEISPPYQFVVHNIARVYPNIRVILCVRNPVERLVSHARMVLSSLPPEFRADFLTRYGTADSLLLQSGCYRNTVLACEALGMQLHVVDFRDLVHNQRSAFDGVCNFLDIDRFDPPRTIHEFSGKHFLPPSVVPDALCSYAEGFYARSNSFMLRRFGIDLFSPTEKVHE